MIQDTLKRIEKIIETHETLTLADREKLNELTQQLKQELNSLPIDENPHALSVANFAKLTTHEALKTIPDKDLYGLAEQGLMKSVERYEDSHPRLFTTIKAFIMKLSGLGV